MQAIVGLKSLLTAEMVEVRAAVRSLQSEASCAEGRRSRDEMTMVLPSMPPPKPQEVVKIHPVDSDADFKPSSKKIKTSSHTSVQHQASGKLTELFRAKEAQLTATLSPPEAEQLGDEAETQRSRWLWLSPLATFIEIYLSKALGLTTCKRLPSLVALCGEDELNDEDAYMSLAIFISLSECGFFIWDVCLTMGLVQKFIYSGFTMATFSLKLGALQMFNI